MPVSLLVRNAANVHDDDAVPRVELWVADKCGCFGGEGLSLGGQVPCFNDTGQVQSVVSR